MFYKWLWLHLWLNRIELIIWLLLYKNYTFRKSKLNYIVRNLFDEIIAP